MIRSLKELDGKPVLGQDVEIGTLDGIYFDDYLWIVRYLVIQTGEWLDRRKVLISVYSVDEPAVGNGSLRLKLPRSVVRQSPDIDLQKPVSRQKEIELHEYYRWPFYWAAGGTATGMGPGSLAAVPMEEQADEAAESRESPDDAGNPNLRSFREVRSYSIQARDGGIGKVDDFLIEDVGWNVLYMVVDTGSWLPGRKVLVSPQWVEKVEWPERRVYVDLSQETIEKSPEYSPDMTPSREYEEKLYRHYGKDRYW